MAFKRLYLTAIILFSLIFSMTVVPALADDPSVRPDDSVREDWLGAEPQYDPDWPPPYPAPCDGINDDDKHDSLGNLIYPTMPRAFGPFIPSSDMVVTRLEFIFRDFGLRYALGIWSDDGGNPGKPSTVLAYTEYFQISTVAAWQGADLIRPLRVSAGTKYWIVISPLDGLWLGYVGNPSPPYILTKNYLSFTGNVTGGTSWQDDLSNVGYKVRIYCEPPVGGNLQPLSNSFEIVRWATIPIIALIIATVYATYLRKTRIFQ